MIRSTAMAAAALCLLLPGAAAPAAQTRTVYDVHAVRFATLPAYRLASLVTGADLDQRMDLAMMVWAVRGGGRTVLVDAGFYREKFLARWKPRDDVRPSDNAYLYENLERQRVIAQTLDAASNLAAQARMLKLAGGIARVVPGHDPAVFERFPLLGPNVATIRRP